MKVHVQDLCSYLCHTRTLLPEVEDNQEEGINSTSEPYRGALALLFHLLPENTPFTAMVSEAKSSLECEASWFPG